MAIIRASQGGRIEGRSGSVRAREGPKHQLGKGLPVEVARRVDCLWPNVALLARDGPREPQTQNVRLVRPHSAGRHVGRPVEGLGRSCIGAGTVTSSATVVRHLRSRVVRAGKREQTRCESRELAQHLQCVAPGLRSGESFWPSWPARNQIPPPSANESLRLDCACVTRLPAGTDSVSQTEPPITEPRPIEIRPSTVAPA